MAPHIWYIHFPLEDNHWKTCMRELRSRKASFWHSRDKAAQCGSGWVMEIMVENSRSASFAVEMAIVRRIALCRRVGGSEGEGRGGGDQGVGLSQSQAEDS